MFKMTTTRTNTLLTMAFLRMCDGRELYSDFTVWCDLCAVSLPGTSVLCSVSSKGMLWQFFFEVTTTGTANLIVLANIFTPCINILFYDDHYFQHDDVPLHYHADEKLSQCWFPWTNRKCGVSILIS
jgi:hypothetical protein